MTPHSTGHRSLMTTALVLIGVFSPGDLAAELPDPLFRPTTVTADLSRDATVLSGHFLGRPSREIAVLTSDETGATRVTVHAMDQDGWSAIGVGRLEPDVEFVDSIVIGGMDRLLVYRRGTLAVVDIASWRETALLPVHIPFRGAVADRSFAGAEAPDASHASFLPQLDISHDLNDDGREDIVFPGFDGFLVALQRSDGTFPEPVTLGPPEPMLANHALGEAITYREAGLTPVTMPWYLGRLYRLDHNDDGRMDLLFWRRDHFEVHHQMEDGSFDPQPYTFTTTIKFDGDGIYTLLFAFGKDSTFGLLTGMRERSRFTMLRAIEDLDGDGVADLLLQTVDGRSVLRLRNRFAVHKGFYTRDGLRFTATAGAEINPIGRTALVTSGYASAGFDDLTGDGRADFVFRRVTTGPLGMARATLGNSVPVNVDFYPHHADGYPERPIRTRKIRRFAPLAGIGNIFFPPVLLGDLTGDGRAELLYGQDPETLHVLEGVAGPDPFARNPVSIKVDLPYDERDVWLDDLNADGRQDIMIRIAPRDGDPGREPGLMALVSL